MHDAMDAAAVVGFHRDHLPAVPLGEESVLHHAPPHRVGEGGLGALLQAGLGGAKLAPRGCQLLARAIGNIATGGDCRVDFVAKPPEVATAVGDHAEPGDAISHFLDNVVGAPGRPQGLSRFYQVARFEHLADGRGVDVRPDVMRAGERDIDAELVEEPHLSGLGLQLEGGGVVGFWLGSKGELTAHTEGSLIREQAQDLAEFEHAGGMGIHESSVERSPEANQQFAPETPRPYPFPSTFPREVQAF